MAGARVSGMQSPLSLPGVRAVDPGRPTYIFTHPDDDDRHSRMLFQVPRRDYHAWSLFLVPQDSRGALSLIHLLLQIYSSSFLPVPRLQRYFFAAAATLALNTGLLTTSPFPT
jgi:hypothetical protein